MANVGYATLQIIPSAKGFTTALEGQVAPGMAAAGASTSQKFGGGFIAGFKGLVAPLAAVAGTTAIAGFFKDAVSGASDLNETLSKSSVIFGQAQKDIVKFAEDSKRNILLTKQEAIDAASTFGIFGKSAGLTGKDLAGFSTQLTSLASDLSSFYNTSTDDAITALGAALRGESEPIRRYGVLLDDASLRAEAFKQGLISSTKQALTPQQRVLAAQALILKQTSDAQGDAARTADGLANQQRILAKNFQDIKVQVGQALLPVVNGLVHALNAGLKPAFEGIKSVIGPVVGFFQSLGGSSDSAGQKVSAFGSTVSSLGEFLTPIVEQLRQIGEQIAAVVGPAFQAIAGIIQNQVLPAFRAFLPAVQPILQFLIETVGAVLIGALNAALGIVKGVLNALSGVLNVFAGLFTGDWSRLWQGVKQIFSGIWDAIVGIFKGVFVILKEALSNVVTVITAVFKTAFELTVSFVKSGIVNLVNVFATIGTKIFEVLTGLPAKMLEFGKNLIMGFINGIKSMAGNIISAIKEVITDKLPGFVKKALGINSPSKVFAGIGKNVGLGFVAGIDGTKELALKSVDALTSSVTKAANANIVGSVSAPGVVGSIAPTATAAKASGMSSVNIYNYNPVAEPTSVTVSNTLTRLALIGGGR